MDSKHLREALKKNPYLPSLQKICSKGIGGEGKGVVSNEEWQQVPKTLGKNNHQSWV